MRAAESGSHAGAGEWLRAAAAARTAAAAGRCICSAYLRCLMERAGERLHHLPQGTDSTFLFFFFIMRFEWKGYVLYLYSYNHIFVHEFLLYVQPRYI